MKPSSYLISRRHLLKGAGTAALGLPVLDIMKPAVASAAARAAEKEETPRFCVLYKGCGVYPHAVKSSSTVIKRERRFAHPPKP